MAAACADSNMDRVEIPPRQQEGAACAGKGLGGRRRVDDRDPRWHRLAGLDLPDVVTLDFVGPIENTVKRTAALAEMFEAARKSGRLTLNRLG